jgi:hypothetical protein
MSVNEIQIILVHCKEAKTEISQKQLSNLKLDADPKVPTTRVETCDILSGTSFANPKSATCRVLLC